MKVTALCKAYAERELKRYEENYQAMEAKINLLQAELGNLKYNFNECVEVYALTKDRNIELKAENERLREIVEMNKLDDRNIGELVEFLEDHTQYFKVSQVKALKAENEKLRSALRDVVGFKIDYQARGELEDRALNCVYDMHDVALKALEDK